MSSTISIHVYEVRPRKEKRGVDLISDALPFGWLRRDEGTQRCYQRNRKGPCPASSRSHDAVIRVYDAAGNVIEVDEHKAHFKAR